MFYYGLRLPKQKWVFLRDKVLQISHQEIIDVMIQVNIAIKLIHESGYTYNNFKLRNIIISDQEGQDKMRVQLIDFENSKLFITSEGQHINELLSQTNIKSIETPCRKKDMIGMITMLFFLLNKCTIPF